MKMRYWVVIFSFLVLFPIGGLAAEEDQPDTTQENLYREIATQIKLFGEVYRRVNQRYVDPIDPQEFIRAAIGGMLGTLDPYTVFFEPENLDELDIITRGEYGGVGIEIGLKGLDKELTVIAPIDDSPAARVGLRSGDVIIAVDGKSTKGFTTADAARVIRGPEGSKVTLSIRRTRFDEPLEYTLVRENIRIHDVSFAGLLEGDRMGYIKLSRFSGQAGEEFAAALKEVLSHHPAGLVLDLRSNPGGLLPSAVDVAQQLLAPGEVVVSTRGRTAGTAREYDAAGEPQAAEIPLVVLINGGSASASEIVAGAIQDHDRGVLIGTPTFGKGLVQTVVNLSDGSALKITTARYYTPSGRSIQREGTREGEDEEMEAALSGEQQSVQQPPEEAATGGLKYFTDSGREVLGGGGITPDIAVEWSPPDPAVVEMYRRGLLFEFAQEWLDTHGRPDTVVVTDEMLSQFQTFLDDREFVPPVPRARELEALRELGRLDSLDQAFFTLVEDIEAMLKGRSAPLNPRIKGAVRNSLENELASAIGGLSWRIRYSFDEDPQLAEGIRVLKDEVRYRALLTGTTEIGKSPEEGAED